MQISVVDFYFMLVKPVKTRIFNAGEDLVDFIIEHIPAIKENSVIVVTSKIAALAESRIIPIGSPEDKEKIIREESEIAVHHPYGWLTVRNGLMVGSGGIDESNVEGDNYVLLPKNSFQTAQQLRMKLRDHYKVKHLGVIVTDSRMMPLRQGTLGAAFGYAGFKPLKPYVGKEDIFGREFKRQKVNVADSLATSAVFVMGEGNEQQPLAVIRDIDIEFTNTELDEDELKVPADDDIYYYFYRAL